MLSIHPNARTTPAVRAEIARSAEPSGELARRYGVSTETVRKWRKRGPAQHLAVGLGGVLGGFKWLSQRLDRGGCGDYSKAAFGSVRAGRAAVAGPAPRGAA